MKNNIEDLKKVVEALNVTITESEKPQKVSGWYTPPHKSKFLTYYDLENNKRYGFNSSGEWFEENETKYLFKCDDILATPKEVEGALKKEAVKRGFKIGSRIKGFWGDKTQNILGEYEYKLYESDKKQHFRLGDCCILLDGTWAALINTKTIEELATSIKDFHFSTIGSLEQNLIKYFSKLENKQEIIETLNNL